MALAAAGALRTVGSRPVTTMAPSGDGSICGPWRASASASRDCCTALARTAFRLFPPRRLVEAHVGEDAAPADDNQVIGGLGHLAHQMAGEEREGAGSAVRRHR